MITTLSFLATAAAVISVSTLVESVTLSDLEFVVLDELEKNGGTLRFNVLLRQVQPWRRTKKSQLEAVLIRLENKKQVCSLPRDGCSDQWCLRNLAAVA